jgi:hypothetical protein
MGPIPKLQYPLSIGGYNPNTSIPGSEKFFRKPTRLIEAGAGLVSEIDEEEERGGKTSGINTEEDRRLGEGMQAMNPSIL